MRRLAATLIIAFSLGILGCGKSDQDQVKDTLRGYIAAVADGNGDEACKKLAPQTKSALTSQTKVSCKQAVGQLAKTIPKDQRKQAKALDKFDVKVDGEKATATYDKPSGGGKNTAMLEKRGGDWLIVTI